MDDPMRYDEWVLFVRYDTKPGELPTPRVEYFGPDEKTARKRAKHWLTKLRAGGLSTSMRSVELYAPGTLVGASGELIGSYFCHEQHLAEAERKSKADARFGIRSHR